MLYAENPKEFIHKKVWKPIKEFSKAAEYKISGQKSVVFLYTGNKQSENNFMKAIPLQ